MFENLTETKSRRPFGSRSIAIATVLHLGLAVAAALLAGRAIKEEVVDTDRVVVVVPRHPPPSGKSGADTPRHEPPKAVKPHRPHHRPPRPHDVVQPTVQITAPVVPPSVPVEKIAEPPSEPPSDLDGPEGDDDGPPDGSGQPGEPGGTGIGNDVGPRGPVYDGDPILVHPGMRAPRPGPSCRPPMPGMPEMAREAGIEGRVFVQFVVRADGRVDAVRSLDANAPAVLVQAVRGWLETCSFEPALLDGRPVNAKMFQTFQFRLR
jgi:protein TonB